MSATIATIYQQTLDAIAAIMVGGQSYSIDGRTLTRADLPSLQQTADWCKTQMNAASGGSKETQARFRRPV